MNQKYFDDNQHYETKNVISVISKLLQKYCQHCQVHKC